ncbi:MAG: M20 family peptidase [Betaproteobacteria bacterium]|nr:M20 family peptidase [Betaproteobacteria bacterium]
MTDTRGLQAALDAVTADDAVHLVRALVDIPSPTGEERACAQYLHGYMQEAGVDVRLQEIEPGRANVIAALHGEGGGATLMLNGHLDTTFYGEEQEDYAVVGTFRPNDFPKSFEIDGGIYGLGSYNMKGGTGAAFLAVRALKKAGVRLAGNVLASGVAGESEKSAVRGAMRNYDGPRFRGGGVGTRSLLMHCEPIDYAIIAEPSDLYVVNAQAGYVFVKIRIHGRSGYMSVRGSPGRSPGVSVISEAVAVVDALEGWGEEYSKRHSYDAGLGLLTPQVSVGAIESGWPYFPSLIPGVCHVYVNLRLTPAMRTGQPVEELDAMLRSLAEKRPSLKYDLEVFASNAPSTVTPADSEFIRIAVDVMEKKIGLPTRPYGLGEADPSNDTNVFRRHGIPAIKCGPKTRMEKNADAMRREHGVHVHRDDVVAAARYYVHMAFELCANKRGA